MTRRRRQSAMVDRVAGVGLAALASLFLLACGGAAPAPKRSPGGPPPEYELPRDYDMGAPSSPSEPPRDPPPP